MQHPIIYPAGTRVLVRTHTLRSGTVWKQNTPENPYRVEVLLDRESKPHIYNAYYIQPMPHREPRRPRIQTQQTDKTGAGKMTTETYKAIMQKLETLETAAKKSHLAGLTKESSILLNTQDIADLMGLSYQHTYREIVSHPDFPKPVSLTDRRKKQESRRWIAGDVIKYIHSRKQ